MEAVARDGTLLEPSLPSFTSLAQLSLQFIGSLVKHGLTYWPGRF